MNILLTVCSLIGALAAVFFAFDAHRYAAKCENHANRLRASLARLSGVEAHSESLEKQLQKLRGQFHAYKAEAEPTPAPLPERDKPGDWMHPAFCPNYGIAQLEGPSSAAARCECEYCSEMRARRATFRRAEVPHTATGQAKLARLNAGKSDGE